MRQKHISSPTKEKEKNRKENVAEEEFELCNGTAGDHECRPIISIFLTIYSNRSCFKPAKFVKNTISSHDIIIFSKSYCPYCKKAKAVFKELNQKPFVVELDEIKDGWNIQNALSEIVGRRTIPQVSIHGKHVGGSDDTVEAFESGELAKLLGIASQAKDDL